MEWENVRRRFTESIGGDVPVRAITKVDVRRFKDSLVGSTSARTGKIITPATVRKQLGALGTVFAYAVRSGYMDANPVQGVAQVLTKGKPENRRLPFTLDDVKAILDATKCGLLTRDVKEIDGVWCVVVGTVRGSEPQDGIVHEAHPTTPELIDLGFLDFVEAQRRAGHSRIFPKLTAGKDRRRAAQVLLDVRNAILGHAARNVGESYGVGYPTSGCWRRCRRSTTRPHRRRRRSVGKYFPTQAARHASHRTPREQEACGHIQFI